MDNLSGVTKAIEELRRSEIGLTIDDFGTETVLL